jgi:hypothetical protein
MNPWVDRTCLGLLVLAVAGCKSPGAQAPPGATPELPTSSSGSLESGPGFAPVPEPDSTPIASVEAAPEKGPHGPPVPPNEHDPTWCHTVTCDPATELCCMSYDRGLCVPKPTRSDQHSLALACASVDQGLLPLACRSSLDCGRGACCSNVWGDSGFNECVPAHRLTHETCHYGEVCVPGAPCRLPGTTCRDGVCRAARPKAKIACGDLACTGDTPWCCEGESSRTCRSHCALDEVGTECMGKSDCPAGEFCVRSPVPDQPSHTCRRFTDINTPVACRTGSDCPSWIGRFCANRVVACVQEEGRKTCGCR